MLTRFKKVQNKLYDKVTFVVKGVLKSSILQGDPSLSRALSPRIPLAHLLHTS